MPPPPASFGYGPVGVAYGSTRRIGGLATAITALQVASIAGTAGVLAIQTSLAQDAKDFLNGKITESTFDDALNPFRSMSLLVGVVAIAVLVLQIIWSYRIAGNLQQLGRGPITWKPGLTIVVWLLGGCTLSIINFLMLREHWQASDPEAPAHDPGGWRTGRIDQMIIAWFVATIAQLAVAIASGISTVRSVLLSGGTGRSTEDLAESLGDGIGFMVGTSLLSILSTALLLLVVRRLTARHIRLTGEG